MPRLSHCIIPTLLILSAMSQGCADAIQAKRSELCKFVASNQTPDPGSQVKGKVAVVYKGARYDSKFDNGCSLDGYSAGRATPLYFPEEMYARSPEELDTLILIELTKGDFIKTSRYNMSRSVGWTVDVYSGRLTVSMINYKTSTLLRTSIRDFTKAPDEIPFDHVKPANTGGANNSEYVIEPTTAEIQTALKEFSTEALQPSQ